MPPVLVLGRVIELQKIVGWAKNWLQSKVKQRKARRMGKSMEARARMDEMPAFGRLP